MGSCLARRKTVGHRSYTIGSSDCLMSYKKQDVNLKARMNNSILELNLPFSPAQKLSVKIGPLGLKQVFVMKWAMACKKYYPFTTFHQFIWYTNVCI